MITTLTIDPLGEAVATIDAQGLFTITHLETENTLKTFTTTSLGNSHFFPC